MKDGYKYNKEIRQAIQADLAFHPQNKKLQVKHLYSMAFPRKAVLVWTVFMFVKHIIACTSEYLTDEILNSEMKGMGTLSLQSSTTFTLTQLLGTGLSSKSKARFKAVNWHS